LAASDERVGSDQTAQSNLMMHSQDFTRPYYSQTVPRQSVEKGSVLEIEVFIFHLLIQSNSRNPETILAVGTNV
jgi:hypothetical protein